MHRLAALFRWRTSSTVLLGGFGLLIGLIIYVWWPLAQAYLAYVDWHGRWWLDMDWLLIGIFLFMSVTIVAGADLRTDGLILLVASAGGLVIEAWGTQTNLWFYYTAERPPLWIVPAWPIATLCIDRLTRLLDFVLPQGPRAAPQVLYWVTCTLFYGLMLSFVAPTLSQPDTLLALLFCALLILTPVDLRRSLLIFGAGAGLGYFLEVWGTTRQCWTYYTYETPPLFAVLAHGMAALAFWRTGLLLKSTQHRLLAWLRPARAASGAGE